MYISDVYVINISIFKDNMPDPFTVERKGGKEKGREKKEKKKSKVRMSIQ